MGKRRSKYDTEFGASASVMLAGARMEQPDLAQKLGQSTAYVNQVFTGRKRANPPWIDLVADVLKLPQDKRVELHRAAAKDQGFKLDLTKK
jgi:cyanate lyase